MLKPTMENIKKLSSRFSLSNHTYFSSIILHTTPPNTWLKVVQSQEDLKKCETNLIFLNSVRSTGTAKSETVMSFTSGLQKKSAGLFCSRFCIWMEVKRSVLPSSNI